MPGGPDQGAKLVDRVGHRARLGNTGTGVVGELEQLAVGLLPALFGQPRPQASQVRRVFCEARRANHLEPAMLRRLTPAQKLGRSQVVKVIDGRLMAQEVAESVERGLVHGHGPVAQILQRRDSV